MKKLSLAIILITASFTNAQTVLSLNDVLKIALQKSPLLQKSFLMVEQSKSGLQTAYGNFLPSVNGSFGWNWSRAEDEGGTSSFSGFVFTNPPTTSQTRSFSAGLQSNWTLFDGLANFKNLSIAEHNYDAEKFSFTRLKQDVVFQTIAAYYDILNAKKLLQVAEEDLIWNQKNYDIVSEKSRLGAVSSADLYSQQYRLGNAELGVLQAKNNLENGKSTFLFNLGLDVLEKYEFGEAGINLDDNTLELEDNIVKLVNDALQNRVDLKSAQLNLTSSEENIMIRKAGHLPSLSNFMSYNLRANTFDKLFDNRTLTIGLNLSIPIFNGWNTSRGVELAEIDYKAKAIAFRELKREITKNIQKAYLDLTASQKQLEVREKNLLAAQENRTLEEERYKLGGTALLNVLIANSQYVLAKSDLIRAKFEFLKLKEQLKYYVGVLDTSKFE